MPVIPAAAERSRLAELYRSDITYWAGLVVICELVVILIALWVVPVVLAAASAAGPLVGDAAVIGAGA
ncbi:MAG: hypothetical protein M3069_01310 [Chloroflexota bacterium]|nr:hypothetical protein [Chloroflexota bacterium]